MSRKQLSGWEKHLFEMFRIRLGISILRVHLMSSADAKGGRSRKPVQTGSNLAQGPARQFPFAFYIKVEANCWVAEF